MDITIQNASVQDMDRLMKMIDGMSDESPAIPSDDGAPMGGGCSVCGGEHDDHDHVDAEPEPSPCGSDDDEPVDNAQVMRKHMGMLANAANDVEEGRHGNAPANTNDGAPDVKGDTHTDYSIRGAIKNHRASTISGDNPLEDIEESDMFERYTSFTGRAITEHDDGTQHKHPHSKSKKKDDITEVEFNPDGSIKRGSTTTPTPSPAAMQQAQQAVKTPKKTPAQQVGYGTGQVDPRLAQAAAGAKPAPAQQAVGYKAGQVDPRLAQAAAGAKPAPAQAVATGPAGGDRSGPTPQASPSTPAPAVATGPAGGDRSGPTAPAPAVAQAGPAGGDRSGPTAQASPSTPAPSGAELAKLDAELEKQAQVQQKDQQKLAPVIDKITKPLSTELPNLVKAAKSMGNKEVSGVADQIVALNKKLGSLIPGAS